MVETLVYFARSEPIEPWARVLGEEVPGLAVRRPEEVGAEDEVRYALVWKPPAGFFDRYPALRLTMVLGAGIDGLVGRTDLPAAVPVARLVDPDMSRMMAGYVLFAVLRYARDIPSFEAAQRESRWHYVRPREAREIRVGILGLGELGRTAATELARQGFDVAGWSRSPKEVAGIRAMAGLDSLEAFLARTEILVVMLPLTPETRRLLDRERLAQLPAGAKLVNVARGPIVDEAALVDALASGRLGGATLDVFEVEPLPAQSPLWRMPNVLVTPHLASIGLPDTGARQVAENIRRVREGRPILNRVDLSRGY